MVKSVMTALRGVFVGWGNLERKATVATKTLVGDSLVSRGDQN